MLRMSFIIPFSALNFIIGVTEMEFWTFALSLVAVVPGVTIHLFLGTSIPVLADLVSGNSLK